MLAVVLLLSPAPMSSLLDVFDVKGNQIQCETVKKESGIKDGWYDKYNTARELKMAMAIGAVPEKVVIA